MRAERKRSTNAGDELSVSEPIANIC